nr:hypothetical protein GCM10020093_012020 [Planobispora longispora]
MQVVGPPFDAEAPAGDVGQVRRVFDGVFDGQRDEFGLAAHVAVERVLRDPEDGGDPLHRHGVQTFGVRDVHRGRGQGGAGQ